MLGLANEDDAVTLVSRRETRVLARRADQRVRCYDWGNLTSGSRLHALWILLLPFTLINVAGWTHPPRAQQAYGWLKGQIAHTKLLVACCGFLLTATWVLWACDLAVILGYQWTRRLMATAGALTPPSCIPRWVHSWAFGAALDRRDAQRIGLVVAALVVIALAFALFVLNQRSRAVADEDRKVPESAERWSEGGADATFVDDDFFRRKRPPSGRTEWHAMTAVVVFVACGASTVVQHLDDPDLIRIGFEPIFAVVGIATMIAITLLWVVSFVAPWVRSAFGNYDRPPTGRAAGAVTLAFAVTNAVFSGGVFWVVRHAVATAEQRKTRLPLGGELAFTDVYAGLALAWAVVAVVVVVPKLLRPRRAVPCVTELIDPAWRADVDRAQSIARLARRGDAFAVALAGMAWMLAVVTGATRLSWSGALLDPSSWSLGIVEPSGRGVLHRVGAWLLPALVAALALKLRQASGAVRLRTTFGTIYDVTTFWPRRFHALAIRPYSRRAVAELRAHVDGLASGDDAVIILGHSQGSVLACAALAPLVVTTLERVALVTFGSPLATLFRSAFPAHVNDDVLGSLAGKLHAWHNFHRHTDPIGGSLASVTDIEDHCLPDPAVGGNPAEEPTPLEPNRESNLKLAVHSYYLNEPDLKTITNDCMTALASKLR